MRTACPMTRHYERRAARFLGELEWYRRRLQGCATGRRAVLKLPASSLEKILMLVVMHGHSSPDQIDRVVATIREMGLTPHPMPGATRTAIGITGNTGSIDSRTLEVLPGVFELIRVTKPYKLASREMHEQDTTVRLSQGTFGDKYFTIIAGPCSVESDEIILRTADWLMAHGIRFLRGRVQAPYEPLCVSGNGSRGPGDPCPGTREDGDRRGDRVDGYGECRRD